MGGAIHRNRRYVKDSAIIRQYANVTPSAVCWLHGTHVTQCPPHKDGTPSTWVAGHTIDGSTTWHAWFHVSRVPPLPPHPQAPAGGWLAPQCSASNSSTGAAHGNQTRRPNSGWA
jgi:hypothetical protein